MQHVLGQHHLHQAVISRSLVAAGYFCHNWVVSIRR